MPTYWLVPCVAHTFDNNNNTHTRTHATKILWIKVKRINDGFGLIVGFSNCDRNPIKYQSIVYMRLNTKNVKTLFTNERDKLFQLKKKQDNDGNRRPFISSRLRSLYTHDCCTTTDYLFESTLLMHLHNEILHMDRKHHLRTIICNECFWILNLKQNQIEILKTCFLSAFASSSM